LTTGELAFRSRFVLNKTRPTPKAIATTKSTAIPKGGRARFAGSFRFVAMFEQVNQSASQIETPTSTAMTKYD
jgi:hypothetical protein